MLINIYVNYRQATIKANRHRTEPIKQEQLGADLMWWRLKRTLTPHIRLLQQNLARARVRIG
jgi:hypothetical protein